ncbi:MAG: orotate phosphoribosyltransferase [Pseudanabaenaceae cyanobacterium]
MLEPLETIKPKLKQLLQTLAYQEGEFQLASGQTSSYYINCKPVTLHPWGGLWVGQLLFSLLASNTGAVGGLTLGADPIVSAVSVVSALMGRPLPALIVRKQPKGHGTQAWIEGEILPQGTIVAVVEDVVTTGSSAMQAVAKLRSAGYQVQQVLAIVDRVQGGRELFLSQGLEFQALFTIADLSQA